MTSNRVRASAPAVTTAADVDFPLNELLAALPDGVIVLGNDRAIRLLNPAAAALLGKPLEDLLGTCLTLPHPAGVSETHFTQPSGDKRIFEVHASVYEWCGQRQHLVTLRDVTDRRQRENQRLAAHKTEAIARFAEGIAADFNELLTTFLNASARLARSAEQADAAAADLHTLRAVANRAAVTATRLQSFRRAAASHSRASVVDLREVIQRTLGLMRGLIGGDVRVEAHVGDDPTCVLADPAQLQQVLMNLLRNARDAVGVRGRIEVTCAVLSEAPGGPGRVCLTVRDDGCGLDVDEQARIFDPFYTTKPGAAGLGLATALNIVEQSGGTMVVRSRRGAGSTFQITLPQAPTIGQTSTYRVAATRPTVSPSLAGRSALVVEDDEELRDLLTELLTARGLSVTTARDGDEAFEQVRAGLARPDLLITDRRMPGIDGVELVKRLRIRWSRLPVLYVSGHVSDALRAEIHTDERAALVTKPFAPLELLRRVDELLRPWAHVATQPAQLPSDPVCAERANGART